MEMVGEDMGLPRGRYGDVGREDRGGERREVETEEEEEE